MAACHVLCCYINIQEKSLACCWEWMSSNTWFWPGRFPQVLIRGCGGSKTTCVLCSFVIQTVIYVSGSQSWVCAAALFFVFRARTQLVELFGMMQEVLASYIRFGTDVFLPNGSARREAVAVAVALIKSNTWLQRGWLTRAFCECSNLSVALLLLNWALLQRAALTCVPSCRTDGLLHGIIE